MIGQLATEVDMNSGNPLILFSKNNCSLCDIAEDILRENIKEFEWDFKKIDIESDINLLDKFKYKIPVLHRPDKNIYLYWPFPLSRLKEFLS